MAKVFLVGAGPGDVELLTIKAMRCLQQAEVVLVDDLVNSDILQFAPAQCKIIPVGKRGGCRSTPQAFIQRLMLRYARQGKTVVRLKGGDPMLFGRGGEEVAFLAEHGIACQVVNGLTAGLVAATQADIPLTHRDHTQGVTFITGHRRDGSQPNWPALVAGGTTLVVYMGMQNINVLCQEWRQAGMPETMPAAVIQHASTPQQRILISELSRLAADVEAGGYGSPAIIVLGEVVKEKTWRDTLPHLVSAA